MTARSVPLSALSSDEIVAGLVARGVPRERALVAAGVKLSEDRTRPALTLPLRFTLPWSALISENRRFCARDHRIFMTAEYKAARAKVVGIARQTMQGSAPLASPLALHAKVYFPDNRIHDAPNFAGATANALKGIVFVDDVWLYRATWERAGVDVDAPRAEIDITALEVTP